MSAIVTRESVDVFFPPKITFSDRTALENRTIEETDAGYLIDYCDGPRRLHTASFWAPKTGRRFPWTTARWRREVRRAEHLDRANRFSRTAAQNAFPVAWMVSP